MFLVCSLKQQQQKIPQSTTRLYFESGYPLLSLSPANILKHAHQYMSKFKLMKRAYAVPCWRLTSLWANGLFVYQRKLALFQANQIMTNNCDWKKTRKQWSTCGEIQNHSVKYIHVFVFCTKCTVAPHCLSHPKKQRWSWKKGGSQSGIYLLEYAGNSLNNKKRRSKKGP